MIIIRVSSQSSEEKKKLKVYFGALLSAGQLTHEGTFSCISNAVSAEQFH